MVDDKYKMKEKSDTELHQWLIEHKPGTAEYMAAIEESMRRVAIIEELMEKEEAPVRKREFIAIGIALVSIIVAIIAIVLSH